MSAGEIINELGNLTNAQMRLVRRTWLNSQAENEDVTLCNQAVLEDAVMLDHFDEERRRGREPQ
jgi:hypothetical protein